jgi:catechol 2,3-dioxygenase-like lactoylglutathione lyase family enzyme
MARPTIRHMAIFARDTKKMAEFYRDVFEMEIVHSMKAPNSDKMAWFVTDGYMNLAILPHRLTAGDEMHPGLHHFGFKVEDYEAIAKRIADVDGEPPQKRPSNRPYAEHRGCDTEGNLFDIAEAGFARGD